MQRFGEVESLLEAFETISLRDYHTSSSRPDRRGSGQTSSERDGRTSPSERKNDNTNGSERRKTVTDVKRCFNCGARDHIISANCPSKDRGTKCFKCGEFGQIASKCSGKNDVPTSYLVTLSSHRKHTKDVAINGKKIKALIIRAAIFS